MLRQKIEIESEFVQVGSRENSAVTLAKDVSSSTHSVRLGSHARLYNNYSSYLDITMVSYPPFLVYRSESESTLCGDAYLPVVRDRKVSEKL